MGNNEHAEPTTLSDAVTEVLPGSSAQWNKLDITEGKVLAERFRVSGRLGKGAMGAVFKAWDKTLKKYVALKFRLASEEDSTEINAQRRQRFLNEVKKAQRISHPNICRIHDVWTSENHEFISMEFIEGEDLERKLLREGALELEEAFRLGQEICAGLGAIHSRDLFHQDLKPANVMIHPKEGAKISDFGLADEHFQGGTRRYASPEQLIEHKVYAQSDLFSLGLILHEMLSGRRALHRDSLRDPGPQPIRAIRAEVPPDVEAIIAKCLQRDPSRRPKSVGEIEAILARARSPEPSPRRPDFLLQFFSVMAFSILLVLLGHWWWNSIGHDSLVPGNQNEGNDVLPPWVKSSPIPEGEDDWARDGSRLIGVPGGNFTLGSEDLDEDSKPIHSVELSPFWITKVPITHAQFQVYLESNVSELPPKYWKSVDRSEAWQPVVGVTWDAARRYCQWAEMDLPTEAQWEASARGKAGQERYPYPWGADPPSAERALFTDSSLSPTRPEQVGTFPLGAGPFGTLDQLGNVWEWCRDGWNNRAYDGRNGKKDPVEPFENARVMVARGNSYKARARDLHVSYRASLERDRQNELTGFRCVYEPIRPENGLVSVGGDGKG